MRWEETARESSDPYYDLIDDFDLIISSFQSQYGIRLSRELKGMKWSEFRDLLIGISPDTALGRIVSIRAENDMERVKNFSKSQYRVWSLWRQRQAGQVSDQDMQQILEGFKQAFIDMAGGGNH